MSESFASPGCLKPASGSPNLAQPEPNHVRIQESYSLCNAMHDFISIFKKVLCRTTLVRYYSFSAAERGKSGPFGATISTKLFSQHVVKNQSLSADKTRNSMKNAITSISYHWIEDYYCLLSPHNLIDNGTNIS